MSRWHTAGCRQTQHWSATRQHSSRWVGVGGRVGLFLDSMQHVHRQGHAQCCVCVVVLPVPPC